MGMRIKVLLILTLICTAANTNAAYAAEPAIKASSAILAMADGEQALYAKNPDERIYPSGLTKLMTALIAYENLGLDETVTVPDNLSEFTAPLEQSIGLTAGEQLASGDLISAILIGSANDAAACLALRLGGIDSFVGLMNDKAGALGLSGTHFTNPAGSHNAEHYSTARDLLVLYKSLCAIPRLNKLLESSHIKIAATNKSGARTIWTGNSLTSKYYSLDYHYPYATGGKSSASSAGGYSVISSGGKGNAKFICVVVNSVLDQGVNYAFVDAKNLFEYGFKDFTLRQIAQQGDIMREVKAKNAKGQDHILLYAKNTVRLYIENDDTIDRVGVSYGVPDFVTAPIKKGDEAGSVTYTYQGRTAATLALVIGDDIGTSGFKVVGNSILWFFSLKPVKLIFFVVGAAILVYAAVVFYIIAKARKKGKRAKKR